MACFQCGKEGGTGLTLCPDCAKAKRESYTQGLATKAEMIDVLAKESGLGEKQLRLAAAALFAMICLLSSMLYYTGAFGFGTLPNARVSPTGKRVFDANDPCIAKERCVIVFLSPNSPDSQRAVPLMNILLSQTQNNPKVAAQIIIGGDKSLVLDEFAASLKGATFQDTQDDFQKAVAMKSIPSWWVIDTKRHVLARGSSLPSTSISANAAFSEFVHAYLKMDDYF